MGSSVVAELLGGAGEGGFGGLHCRRQSFDSSLTSRPSFMSPGGGSGGSRSQSFNASCPLTSRSTRVSARMSAESPASRASNESLAGGGGSEWCEGSEGARERGVPIPRQFRRTSRLTTDDGETVPYELPVGRCKLPVSRPVLKAHMVSALETKIRITAF